MIANYLSFIKFSHTIFAMPFAMIGFFLATHHYGYPFFSHKLLLVILCMIFARSAAMAFNRYADREIDAQNLRTAQREIPAGIISERAAIAFIALNSSLFIFTTYWINNLCLYLSPIALIIVLGYSYTKRFTALCHFILGIGLSLAPIGAFIAVSEKFHLLPILYGTIVLLWVTGFDIIYALQDENFDREKGLQSIPSRLGKNNALKLSTLLHIVCAIIVLYAGILANFGTYYFLGAIAFITLLTYQHTLVKPDDLSRVNLAFFTTNGIASIIFCFFVLLELLL